MGRRSDEFKPRLRAAQESLEVALKEACAVDVKRANTGELIHIDELLAVAGDSAKQVISVRRRMRRDAGEKGRTSKNGGKSPSGKGRVATATGSDASPTAPPESRVFEDAHRVRWTTFAVHPSQPTADRARLPGPFQSGWLSFDSGSETRRLSPIPENWHLLSDDELRALCDRAAAAPRRSRGPKPS